MLTDPAGPPLAFPLLIVTGPLGPCKDLPVFNIKVPLVESSLLPAEALVITLQDMVERGESGII